MFQLRTTLQRLLDLVQCLARGKVLVAEHPARVLEYRSSFRRHFPPFQANAVGATNGCRHTLDHEVRRDILGNTRIPAHERHAANPDKLVYSRHAADDSTVLNDNMTGQLGAVGHDDVIAQLTIVSDVTVGHNEAIVPYPRGLAIARSRIDRSVFTYRGAIAYRHKGLAALVLEILSTAAEAHEGKHFTLHSEGRPGINEHMRHYLGAIPNPDVWANHRVCADLDTLAEFSARVYDRCWMNICCHSPALSSVIIHIISA